MFQSWVQRIRQARRDSSFFFASLLPEQIIREAFPEASQPEREGTVYTRPVVVWMFLAQVLCPDHSCRPTVARLIAWLAGQGRKPCSAETGTYCTARGQLSETGCHQLVTRTARAIDQTADESWHWHGHEVKVVDGATETMPDTEENQRDYPQQSAQAPGCGQPSMRMVVLFSLATGVALQLAMTRYKGKRTGENTLFRNHISQALNPGDVLLGDRFFSSWFDIALLQQQGVEVVVRKHQKRKTDFRTGARIRRDDHLVIWPKPQRPKWMSQEQYDSLPDELVLREVRIHVRQRGFRSRPIIVVTTLWDHQKYPAAEIAELFRRRWQAELNLRSLKTQLQMVHLRCKTPDRVRNEARMHLTAYNLIRGTMVEAARRAGLKPWHLSFKGTVQTVNEFLPATLGVTDIETWVRTLLKAIATHVVGNRPNRVEPRVVKRRPKGYKLMNQPREILRKSLPTIGI
jgi:putative transposase